MVYARSIVGPRVCQPGVMKLFPQYVRCPQPHNPLRASLVEQASMGLRIARTWPPQLIEGTAQVLAVVAASSMTILSGD